MNDTVCGECGSCSMGLEDTDNDGIGEVCDESPYAVLCQSYCDKCKCCLGLRDAGGEVDYSVCAGYTDSTACENANCTWNSQGLPPPGVCTVDICLADNDFSGRITGVDLSVLKKELGRVDCPAFP